MGLLVLQEMPPIRARPEALHFEVAMDDRHYGYLTDEDVGDIQGTSLADGGVLKPVDTWISGSGMVANDEKTSWLICCRSANI